MVGEAFLLSAVTWQPAIGVWSLTLLLLLAAVVVRRAAVLLAAKCGRRRAALLAGLRASALALLVVALLDPASERRVLRRERRSVAVVVDGSSSMDVADRGAATGSRRDRAAALAEAIVRGVPSGVGVARFIADPALGEVDAWPGAPEPAVGAAVRDTDLAAALVEVAVHPDIRDSALVVLLTDGGDGPVEPARMPSMPLLVVGVAGDPATWRDIAVDDVVVPERVEVGSRVRVEARATARTGGDEAFRSRLGDVRLVLESADGERWRALGETRVDLRGGAATASFETVSDVPGFQRWRVRADGVRDELSDLNNERRFHVNVVRESLKVLYFARRLGADLKSLRQELASDPAVSFSTLVQTAGGKFLLQGDARTWEGLENVSGLPAADVLRRFDTVVVGSFPATEWTLVDTEALRTYVDGGGGLVWVGGEHSFDAAYAASPLAELIPWQIGPNAAFARTPAGVSPTADGASATATTGLWDMLRADSSGTRAATPELQAVNVVGPLKPGATALLAARTATDTVPLLVEQPYGRGRVFALASNTTWRWATSGPPLDRFYRRLWRQIVRAACGEGEASGLLRVRLDRDVFGPGERVGMTVELLSAGGQAAVSARLESPTGLDALGLERDAAVSGLWRGAFVCKSRGRHVLRVQVERGQATPETWERAFEVAPREQEGARLALDEAKLRRLARDGAGEFMAEDEDVPRRIAELLRSDVRTESAPLVQSGPWYVLLLLAVLCTEWTLRRRANLV